MKETVETWMGLRKNLRRRFAEALTLVLFICSGALAVKADPEAPQFASSYNVRGEDFTWTSAEEDGSSYHTDHYTSPGGGSLSVSGPYDQSYDATVSGSNSSGFTGRSIDGFLYMGGLLINENYVLPANSSVTMTIGGQTATLSGGSYVLTYSSDGTWTSSSSESYSGPGGSYSSSSYSDSSANSSGSTSTQTSETYPANGTTTTLFGKTLSHVNTIYTSQTDYSYDSWSATSSETSSNGSITNYGNGSSTLARTVISNTDSSANSTEEYSISGYDPDFGSFSASSTEEMPTAVSRAGPTFRNNSPLLWVDGTPVTWSSGGVDVQTGDVTDTYSDGTFSISGNLAAWIQNQAVSVFVDYNGGTYSGTITGTPSAPVFSIGGLTIQTSVQRRWALTWTIRGEVFEWVSANASGNTHTDTYASSAGGTLSVSGEIEGSEGNASLSGQNSAAYTGKTISGFYYQGNLLIDENTILPANPALTMNIGGQPASFTGGSNNVTYTDGGANSYFSSSATYSGPGGTYSTSSSSDASGNSWSDSTITQTEAANGSTVMLFGKTLAHVNTTSTSHSANSSDYLGYSYSTASGSSYQTFQNGATTYAKDEAWESYTDSANITNGTSTTSISVHDPDLGSFSTTSTDGSIPTAFSTPGAVFARDFSDIWINGTMMTWSHGDIDFNGNANDYFDGGNVVISGNAASLVNSRTADISVYYQGSTYSGTVTGTPAAPVFLVPGLDIQLAEGTRTTPVFTAETLYVNGTPYTFASGGNDNVGHYSDKYLHSSFGVLVIAGNNYNISSGAVTISYNGQPYVGTYQGGGNFSVPGVTVSTSPMTGLPAGFWVRGRYYHRDAETNLYRHFTPSAPIQVSGAEPNYTLTGSDAGGPFAGSYNSNGSGLFMLLQEGTPTPAVAVNGSGAMILSAESPPTGMPPAVKITGHDSVYVFIGTGAEDTSPGTEAAYYGFASGAHQADNNHWLLKIRNDGSGSVTFTDYHGAVTHKTGNYHAQTRLFQTGVSNALPMPISAVDAAGVLWNPLAPPAGLPPTFVLNGKLWRYTGSDSAGDHYIGYVPGQELVVAPADLTGKRLLTVTDPIDGDGTGTLTNGRGYADLGDGRIVYSGNYEGGPLPPVSNPGVHTIASDLDITGNVLSLGSRADDVSVAGLSLGYEDANSIGTLHLAMNRAVANWIWSRASNDTSGATRVPMMTLSNDHALNLFTTDGLAEGVVLDPRPGQGSKLPRLELTNPPELADATGTTVLTLDMSDARYLRTDGATVVSIYHGINVNMGPGTDPNAVAEGGAAIGNNLIGSAGQLVVGRNNLGSNDLFVVGAGTGSETGQRRNALAVSAEGHTSVNGNLMVSGTITIGGEAVLTSAAAGATYLTPTLGDARYLTPVAANALYLTPAAADTAYLKPATAAALYITSTAAAESYLSVAAAQAQYLDQASAAGTYLTKIDAQTVYLEAADLEPLLDAERATSDGRYHRKDQPLQVNTATDLNGALTSNAGAAFNNSLIINGELDSNGTVRAKPGQEVLIPEQGDISMGEFRAGTKPVVVP